MPSLFLGSAVLLTPKASPNHLSDILEETTLEDKYETAGAYMADYFYSADGQEGLQAHYEKRRGVCAHT